MRTLVLGTAGHIDHGKTALVRALTGTDTDRLPDEKRRGITIDLGFAQLPLPDGTTLSIVDVPGHEAFVRNMLAGATGIDLVLLTVAADEGVMPQTREHLAILQLLGIRRGVVALTKADLVDPDWLELVRDELRELLAPSSLADAPVRVVSARTGAGLDELVAALADAARQVEPRAARDLFRMPIDRTFTVRGTGTVVTGTVWSGSLRRDAHVRVLPADFTARVRALQQHGVECDEVAAGARAAVALSGVDRDAIARGDTLLDGAGWTAGSILTVHLRVLPDARAPIAPRQRVRVHLGTAEMMGRVALLPAGLEPGASAIAQLRLETPVVARTGDHIVIRSWSPVHTIAGATVLEPAAPKRKRLAPDIAAALATLARHAGTALLPGEPVAVELLQAAVILAGPRGLQPVLIPHVTGLPPDQADAALRAAGSLATTGDAIVRADLLAAAGHDVLQLLAEYHRREPMLDGMEREALRRAVAAGHLFDAAVDLLLATGRVVPAGNALALPDHAPRPRPDALAAIARIADIYRAARLEPPELVELPPELRGRTDLPLLIRYLEREGTLLRLTATRPISARAVSDGIAAVKAQLAPGQPLTVLDFKNVLKLTRKHLIPLLEHLDRTGVTRRNGEVRTLD